AIKNNDWTVTGMIGKMDNPFQLSNMIWDYDINPEGAALQLAYNLSDQHSFKANSGIFVLDEFNQGNPTPYVINGTNITSSPSLKASHDPYLYGGERL